MCDLSMVASAYFIAYAVMQVPTGMLLDRFGPRRTIATMLLFAALGATLFSVGHSATALVTARLLMALAAPASSPAPSTSSPIGCRPTGW